MHLVLPRVATRKAYVVVAVIAAMIIPASTAMATPDTLEEAQAGITAAREASDRAAMSYDTALNRYYELENDLQAARKLIARDRARQAHLAAIVRKRAVVLYTQESTGLDILNPANDILDTARRTTFGSVASERAESEIDDLGRAQQDLEVQEAALQSQLERAKRALADIKTHQRELEQALAEATQAEQQLRERLAREQRVAEYAALVRQAQAAAARARQALQPDPGDSSSDSPSAEPNADGGSAADVGDGSWLCPVSGGASFTNTWGAPRDGGRTHKGIDMFGSRGTDLVAVVSGSVFYQTESVGGNSAYLQGSDGNTYYYAHLNDYVGGARSVDAGEVIGHLGNTGNASDAPPHLHFEIRPGGPNGEQINPYATLRSHC